MNAPDATSEQKTTREVAIAFQGAPGAYSHVAARVFLAKSGKDFGLAQYSEANSELNVDFSSSRTFQDVFNKVANGSCQFGVLPLANSSVGCIMQPWELALQYEVSIISDVYLPIHHQLIGLPSTNPREIKTVISHPVALKQCTKFLAQMNWASAQAFWDTAGAVLRVKELNDPTMVAIAGEPSARLSGLSILAKDIEDFSHNETRFGIIAPVAVAMAALEKNFPRHPRLTCCVELDPATVQFGTFVAETISKYDANVNNFFSLCIPERLWQNRYVIEMDLASGQITQAVWTAVRDTATKARILGIYGSHRM